MHSYSSPDNRPPLDTRRVANALIVATDRSLDIYRRSVFFERGIEAIKDDLTALTLQLAEFREVLESGAIGEMLTPAPQPAEQPPDLDAMARKLQNASLPAFARAGGVF